MSILDLNVRTSEVDDGNSSAIPRREDTKLAAKFVFKRHKDFREIFVVDWCSHWSSSWESSFENFSLIAQIFSFSKMGNRKNRKKRKDRIKRKNRKKRSNRKKRKNRKKRVKAEEGRREKGSRSLFKNKTKL